MQTLLVEILTEELPPKALPRLGLAFAEKLAEEVRNDDLGSDSTVEWYATPRRLAVSITNVRERAPDRAVDVQGPSVKVALDAEQRPTQALLGFARKNNAKIDELEQRDTPKGKVFVYRSTVFGALLDDVLGYKVMTALKRLPIPKMMRWGSGDEEFVRPVHGVVMLHGARVVRGVVLGLTSGNTTAGHRFLSSGPITLLHADEYEVRLREHAVVARFSERREYIALELARAAGPDARVVDDPALLDEVTALTEAPIIYQGAFDAEFLSVPKECLILSMKQHQKYFPLLDRASDDLTPRFLIVSNLPIDDPRNIVNGNERVLRARLADAKFFYDHDRRTRLEARVPQLEHVVYHNRLGSQLERVGRIQALTEAIARTLGADVAAARRAAYLAKADLLSDMVGEFPELQGTMGRYYARHDGEAPTIADAIEAHYRPRHAGDALPESLEACAVALADRLEALVGLFGLGQQPTGEKDPYALRRQAVGVIRIVAERALPLRLSQLIDDSYSTFSPAHALADAREELRSFFFDRMRGYLADTGASMSEIDAVLTLKPDRIDLVPHQLEAVRLFNSLPQAPSLAAANKRIANILKRAGPVPARFDDALLVESAEQALARAYTDARLDADRHYENRDYSAMLTRLAHLKEPVDAFFDAVMVMTEDARLRDNRIALLAQLHATMNRVADISKLAA